MRNFLHFLLFLVAVALFALVTPIAFFYALLRVVFTKDEFKGYWKKIAIGIDQLGGVVCAPLFNDIFVKPGGHQFGNEDEVPSSVFGKNKRDGKHYLLGKIVAFLLNVVDKNHVEESIEE